MKKVNIAERWIGTGCPAFIIAEAGVNHNGSLKIAKRMVDAAKAAGADAIKFQTFKTEELATADAPKADYQKRANRGESQFQMLKKLELSELLFKELSKYCKKRKIMFLSTPFDGPSVDLLRRLFVPAFKISSGDLTNIPLIRKIAAAGKPVILSTGMATMAEIRAAVRTIRSAGNEKLVLLHCTSNYPAKYGEINLRAMDALRRGFNVPIGYSDHTDGLEVAVAAVALGANVIEKHFTLDKNMVGPDHRASITHGEFRAMVKSIRKVEKALGSEEKAPQKSEIEISRVARKSIVAAKDIAKGMKLSIDMLAIKRPGTGIEPKYIYKLVGRRLKRNISKDQVLAWGKDIL